jgi:hypothetical protein
VGAARQGAAGWGKRAAGLLIALYALALLYGVLANGDRMQWDFQTYYYAGRAFAQGLDPYDLQALSQVAGREIGYPFAYSPVTLPVFEVLGVLDLRTASVVYLALKVAALAALIVIWRRWFVRSQPDLFFYLFLLFGFGGAIYADLTSGNISLFEQVALWVAFAALARGRAFTFTGLVVAVALFKLTPILLLGLLLIRGGRRPGWVLAGGIFLFTAALGLSYAIWPHLFTSFLQGGWSFDERGGINPSSLALLRDIYEYLLGRGVLPEWDGLPWLGYLAWVAGVMLITRRAAARNSSGEPRTWIYVGCLAYVLIAPRFKNYAYILLLLPAYELLRGWIAVRSERALLFVLMLSGSPPVPFGLSAAAGQLIAGYYSLLGAGLLWGLAVRRRDRMKVGESSNDLTPASEGDSTTVQGGGTTGG